MKILVTGADGMLGSDFCLYLRSAHHDVAATNRQTMDVTDADRVRRVIAEQRPDLVVHAAADSNADRGEIDPDTAFRVNAVGTWNVALACAEARAQLLYVSSCGVFDGKKKSAYTELDVAKPLTQHHRSKLEGERLVAAIVGEHFILRPGWLFGGGAAQQRNFVAQRYREALGKPSINSANDRFGSPTYTMDFARAAMTIVESQAFGLYHVANAGIASRFDYVSACIEALGLPAKVNPVSSDFFPRPAPSPVCEALDTYFMRLRGFPPLPAWRASITSYTHSRLLPELQSAAASV